MLLQRVETAGQQLLWVWHQALHLHQLFHQYSRELYRWEEHQLDNLRSFHQIRTGHLVYLLQGAEEDWQGRDRWRAVIHSRRPDQDLARHFLVPDRRSPDTCQKEVRKRDPFAQTHRARQRIRVILLGVLLSVCNDLRGRDSGLPILQGVQCFHEEEALETYRRRLYTEH